MQDLIIRVNDKEYNAVYDNKHPAGLSIDGKYFGIEILKHYSDFIYTFSVNNKVFNIEFDFDEKDRIHISCEGFSFDVKITDETRKLIDRFIKQGSGSGFGGLIPLKAPMPGLIIKSFTAEGKSVQKGETLLIIEAMKMENSIKSPCNAIVKRINICEGMAVEKDALLLELEA